MKRIFVLVLALMLCASAAMASTAGDVAAEYTEMLTGHWTCVYSDLIWFEVGGYGIDFKPLDEYQGWDDHFFVAAGADGACYFYELTKQNFCYEYGQITVGAGDDMFVLYKSGKIALFKRS